MLTHWRQLEKETGGKVSQQAVIDSIADEFGWEIKRGALQNLQKKKNNKLCKLVVHLKKSKRKL